MIPESLSIPRVDSWWCRPGGGASAAGHGRFVLKPTAAGTKLSNIRDPRIPQRTPEDPGQLLQNPRTRCAGGPRSLDIRRGNRSRRWGTTWGSSRCHHDFVQNCSLLRCSIHSPNSSSANGPRPVLSNIGSVLGPFLRGVGLKPPISGTRKHQQTTRSSSQGKRFFYGTSSLFWFGLPRRSNVRGACRARAVPKTTLRKKRCLLGAPEGRSLGSCQANTTFWGGAKRLPKVAFARPGSGDLASGA